MGAGSTNIPMFTYAVHSIWALFSPALAFRGYTPPPSPLAMGEASHTPVHTSLS